MIRLIQRAVASIRARTAAAKRRRMDRVPGLVGRPEAYEFKQRFQMAFLQSRGLLPSHTLLDYGCGILRGGVPLIRYLDAGNYVGLEVRPDVLREAQRTVRQECLTKKEPVLVRPTDIERLDLGRRFDYVWSFSVFFHLSDEHVDSGLRFIARHLARNGTVLANVNIGDRKQGTWREFPVVWRTLDEYRARAHAVGLSVSPLGELGQLGHHSPTDPEEDKQVMLAFNAAPPA